MLTNGCVIFLSTPSARRATGIRKWNYVNGILFLSTPSARRATRFQVGGQWISKKFLSTPSARRATRLEWLDEADAEFLSTPSARRATGRPGALSQGTTYFYPRPLRGGRREEHIQAQGPGEISIHALCEEGDATKGASFLLPSRFLSTPSARRATPQGCRPAAPADISIHALCEEGDPA